MERVSTLNGIALREVARIGLLARGAEPHAPGLWVRCGLGEVFCMSCGVRYARDVPRDFLNRHIRRAAFRRFEELDKLAPDKKQLLKESPGK